MGDQNKFAKRTWPGTVFLVAVALAAAFVVIGSIVAMVQQAIDQQRHERNAAELHGRCRGEGHLPIEQYQTVFCVRSNGIVWRRTPE